MPGAHSVERPRTVGVLVDWLESEYQSTVVGGVIDAAREHGVNVVSFVGGVLGLPSRHGRQRNTVYDLAASEGIDGLVVMAGTLGNHGGLAELAAYLDRYRPIPMVSIAATMPGTTGILIDGEHALRDGIRHLVEHHQYRRIAFLGGPANNLEAQARLRTYGEMLATYSLRPPESFVAVGDFQYESGVEAIRVLVDERAVEFDAIVVANDQMSLGVVDALRARGKRVPRDVAIIGFDDIPEARYSAPPLTTIRQPLGAQGRLSVEVLLRHWRGEPVDDVLTLPTELVLRQSCGCHSDVRRANATSHLPPPLTRPGTSPGVEETLRDRRTRIVEGLRDPVAGLLAGVEGDWSEMILDALIGELQGDSAGSFIDQVNRLLERSMASSGTGNAWQPALSALRRELIPCLASDPLMRSRAEDLLQEARVLVADVMEHTQAQRRLAGERRGRNLAEAAEEISASLDLASLTDVLNACLPRIGIPSAQIVLYEPSGATGSEAPDRRATRRRLVFSHERGRARAPRSVGRVVAARALVPAGVLPTDRHHALLVEPLFFKDDALGYVVFELGPFDGLIYETLREQISGVLKVALLIEELVATGAERATLLAALQVRATELEATYQALQDNQRRLLSAEKMASLGRITANIAHEMNTPLAAVRTALIEIEKRAVEYAASVGDPEVTDEDHIQIATEMRASLQLARSAADRAAGFVRGIKTQTRDLSVQEKVRFDPAPVIEEALLLLSYDLRQSGCRLEFRPPERRMELFGSPGILSQVVTNLVTNALDAMPVGGSIALILSESDGAARLVVQDTGTGIPADLRDKVFEPMFTTKPFGQGTGLGLSIVRDLVTGQLGGSVALESEVGVGTTFTMTFPLPMAS